jgi:hypothetical protein
MQLLGELGLPGPGFFLALLALSVVPEWRRLGHPSSEPLRAPVVFGLVGFMLASLLQHPLLVPEVSAAFWLALGLARSTVAVVPVKPVGRLLVSVVALVAIGLAVSIPLRSHSARDALNLEGAGIGLSPWRTDPDDGRRYRVATGHAAIFVDGRGGRLRVPLRARGPEAPTIDVALLLDGNPAGRVLVPAGRWTELAMLIRPHRQNRKRFLRLDFTWAPPTRRVRLDVGRADYAGQGEQ